MLLGLSAYNSSSSDEDREEEKPVKQKKKIAIPQANYHSSDDDDDAPAAKKRSLSNEPKTSGLFSKLPPPRNTIGGGKQAHRPLIPHVFSKKPATSTASNAGSKKKFKTVDNDPDSSDNEDVEFFSFVDKKTEDKALENANSDAASSSVNVSPIESTMPAVASAAPSVPQLNPSENHFPSGSTSNNAAVNSEVPNQSRVASSQITVGPAMDLPENISSWHSDDRFKRIQGKKNHNEKIEIIDVHADSALEGNKELLLQQISEEKNMNRMSHSKKNNNAPSATSKRKHQLSYLIYQAKEREIELKNAWAAGHAARKAARNRYGF